MLLRIPRDITLQILFASRIEDVLSLERTCAALRDTIATRYHWLTQLRNLDQVHAPDFSTHADVHDLPAAQLRDLVVKAVLSYRNWRNGGDDIINTCKKVVFPDDLHGVPPGLEPSPSCELRTMLTPGERFLFLTWACTTSEEIGRVMAIDTRSNDVMWSYSGLESGVSRCGIEMRRGGSMMALVVSLVRVGVGLEIIELTPSRAPKKRFRTRKQWNALLGTSRDADIRMPCVEGDYAAVMLNGDITIINWKEDWVINLFGPWTCIYDMLVQSDHLIYIGEARGFECRLTAIPLRSLECPGHRKFRTLHTGAVKKCTLETPDLVPDGFELLQLPRRLSSCTFPWKTSVSEALLTIFLLLGSKPSSEDQINYLAATQVIFDPHESTSAILKIRHTRTAKCPFLLDNLGRFVQFEPFPFFTTSQSTRTLLRFTFCGPNVNDSDVTGYQQGREQLPPDAPFFDIPQEDEMSRRDVDTFSCVGLDEHGDIYFAPATELTDMHYASSPLHHIQLAPSSGTILCVRKQSRFNSSVEILSVFGRRSPSQSR